MCLLLLKTLIFLWLVNISLERDKRISFFYRVFGIDFNKSCITSSFLMNTYAKVKVMFEGILLNEVNQHVIVSPQT